MTRLYKKSWLILAALMIGVLAFAFDASADKLYLKDGRVLEGRVQKEESGLVYFIVVANGKETVEFFAMDEVKKIERDTTPAPAAKPTAPAPAEEKKDAPKKEDAPVDAAKPAVAAAAVAAPRSSTATPVAILDVGGPEHNTIGIQVAAEAFQRALPILEKELGTDGSGVCVIRMNSGGGMLLEINKLCDIFHKVYKKKFRTVGWIESAISAAAMSMHAIEELYFLPQGNYGACTGFRSATDVMEGRELLEVLHYMEEVSKNMGNRDTKIMRSMQIMDPLSATIDENGQVRWYGDLSGKIIVNPPNRILTFNSKNAEELKFSRGTAATPDELCKAMGLREWVFVGQKASKIVQDFRRDATETETRLEEVYAKYNMAVGLAQRMEDKKDRGVQIGIARRHLKELKQLIDNNSNFKMMYPINDKWFRDQEELLEKLAKR